MIFFETAHQARVFLLLLAMGMVAGALYDGFALFRRKKSVLLTALVDLIYFLLVGGLCFYALFLGGEKALRFYALLGIFCGAGIYCLGIRSIVIFIVKRIKGEKKQSAG